MSLANFEVKNRALGMLLGLHCGDSLGSTMEHKERDVTLKHREITGGGSSIPWRRGQATDDTDLALIILKGIESPAVFNLPKVRGLMMDWYLSDPFDIGETIRSAIKRLTEGDDFGGLRSKASQSNGSLMRVAPLALMNTTPNKTLKICFEQNLLTHGDEITQQIDFTVVETLKYALSAECSNQDILRRLLIGLHRGKIETESIYRDAIGRWEDLPNSGWVIHTITVLAWCLIHCKNTEEALIQSVNLGGDADTNGAVVGAFFGARYGIQSIPERWLEPLELKEDITAEVIRLVEYNEME